MGLFSSWKPHTIVGKILKGAVSVAAPAAAIVTGVGAIGGAISGAGLLAGAVSGVKTAAKVAAGVVTKTAQVANTVKTAAVNLVTGQTKEQRELVQDQKQNARDDLAKMKTIEQLINAGATVQEAAAKVGVPLSQLVGSFGIAEEVTSGVNQVKAMTPDSPEATMTKSNIGLIAAAAIGLLLLLGLKK
jgi:hypothetical protein